MKQTPATKIALVRDRYLCAWCYYRDDVKRSVFAPVVGYPSKMGGGHHVFGRGRVDVPEAIIGLCCEHHWKIHNARLDRCKVIELLEWITGIPLRERYREFHKC